MDLKALADVPPWDWPKDAAAVFLDKLRDRACDTEERLLAAEMAGDYTVVGDELALALLSVAEDRREPPELRWRAAVSLGVALEHADTMGFDDEDDILVSEEVLGRIQEALQRLHQDDDTPEEVRRGSFEASVRAPQDWHRDAIAQAYARPESDWKRTAVFGMAYVNGFGEEIVEALESPDPRTRQLAIEAAGNWEIEGAWRYVAALLEEDDLDKELQLTLIEAIPGLRPDDAAEHLGRFFESEDEDIVAAALEAQAMADGLSGKDLEEDDNFDEDDDF